MSDKLGKVIGYVTVVLVCGLVLAIVLVGLWKLLEAVASL